MEVVLILGLLNINMVVMRNYEVGTIILPCLFYGSRSFYIYSSYCILQLLLRKHFGKRKRKTGRPREIFRSNDDKTVQYLLLLVNMYYT